MAQVFVQPGETAMNEHKNKLKLKCVEKNVDRDPNILEESWSDTEPCTVYNILKFLPTKLNNAVSPIHLVTPAP